MTPHKKEVLHHGSKGKRSKVKADKELEVSDLGVETAELEVSDLSVETADQG